MGQAVIVPLALAVMLTFILTPVVTALERRRLPRIVAVALVVVCTLGVIAALLRFVTYVGSLLAMLLPTALAFVLFEGWARTLATLSVFLVLDAVTANVIEPLLIGHHTGVSSLALLVSALFWTWLWGPIGLLLSTPITVCLAVLGKHVSGLEFLTVLLRDEPALEAEISLCVFH